MPANPACERSFVEFACRERENRPHYIHLIRDKIPPIEIKEDGHRDERNSFVAVAVPVIPC